NTLKKVVDNHTALQDVSFQGKKGETVGFLGPSGSGKTTTIKILTDRVTSTSGKPEVFQMDDPEVKTPRRRNKKPVVPANTGLYHRLKIYDNLRLYCDLYGMPRKRINEVLEMVNLQNDDRKVVSKLSKGMIQRVVLARAFLHEPELLFLDEPTSALDTANSQHIHSGLRALSEKGTTIFLTTHDMSEAEYLCDQVAFLHKGKIQLLDAPAALRKRF